MVNTHTQIHIYKQLLTKNIGKYSNMINVVKTTCKSLQIKINTLEVLIYLSLKRTPSKDCCSLYTSQEQSPPRDT